MQVISRKTMLFSIFSLVLIFGGCSDSEVTYTGDSGFDGDSELEDEADTPSIGGDTEQEENSDRMENEAEIEISDTETEIDSEDEKVCNPDEKWCEGTELHQCNDLGSKELLPVQCGPIGCEGESCNVETALLFDGQTGWVDFGEKFILYGLQEYTVEAWIFWFENAEDGGAVYGEGYLDWASLWVNIRADGTVSFGDFDRTTNLKRRVTTDAGAISPDAWHHIAGVRDGNTYTIFVDGRQMGETETTSIDLPTIPPRAYIGKGGDDVGFFFNGIIDEVKLSSETKYTENFTPAFRYEVDSDTEALWHFNEGSGSIVMDSGNNAHQGTIQENTTWSDDGIWRVFDCAPKWQSCEQNSVQVCNEYGRWVEYQTCEGEEICTETGNWTASCE